MEAPSQFDKFSSAFAVAAAFANRIHGKNGEYIYVELMSGAEYIIL